MTDDIGAFVPGPRVRIEGRPGGPLGGLTFAAKDLFDVAGVVTGGGNHDWPTGRPIPKKNAWAVQTLLDAGATLIGKTITDEVSLGILGENAFDGTPVNVRAPGRVPGGSSSGSAAAVAAGICDTALGTDTGGSVRVPHPSAGSTASARRIAVSTPPACCRRRRLRTRPAGSRAMPRRLPGCRR
jgi:amidase